MNGYALRGFEMLYQSTGDKKYFDYTKRYLDQFVDANGNFLSVITAKGTTNRPSFGNLDNMMTGNALVMMYEQTHDERYKMAATKIRRALDTYPRMLQTIRSQAPGPFALFDVDLGKLPVEDR